MEVHMEDPGASGSGGDQARRPTGPRLYHKKSRTGCLRCKARRVKCDEKRPVCTGCGRHMVECVYPSNQAAREQFQTPSSPEARRIPEVQIHRQTSSHSGSSTHGQTPEAAVSPQFLAAETGSQVSSSAPSQSPIPAHYAMSAASSGHNPNVTPLSLFRAPQPTAGPYGDGQPPMHLADADDETVLDPPESRDRRLWELRLLHNYVEMMVSARPDPTRVFPPATFLWSREMPLMGFEHESILYAILAHSALNLWTQAIDPAEREHMRFLQQTYLGMALREQRRAVSSGVTREMADSVCISSLAILSHAFALVQTTVSDDPTEWQPPLEWLRIGRGTGSVFTVSRGLGQSNDRFSRFLNSPPQFDPDEIFTPETRAELLWLLESPPPLPDDEVNMQATVLDDGADDHREIADKVTRKIYERVLSYIGWTKRSIDAGEAEFAVQRRFAAFAVWMPEIYQDFCQQRRQRALVALAWFFSLWIPYDHLWMINGTGKRQVRAIYHNLEPRWRPKLEPIMTQYGLS